MDRMKRTAVLFDEVDKRIAEFKRHWVRHVEDRQHRWWMEIIFPKDVCIEPNEEIMKVGRKEEYPHVLIPITWDNVLKYERYVVHKSRQYGTYTTDLLRNDLHTIRKEMAIALQRLCKNECVWEMVGSDSNVSDVDINIFDDRVDKRKAEIDKKIREWVGSNRIDALFDMNIYLSAFARKELTSINKLYDKNKQNPFIARIPINSKFNYVFIKPPATKTYQRSQLMWALIHVLDETQGTHNGAIFKHYIDTHEWEPSVWKLVQEIHPRLSYSKTTDGDKPIASYVKIAQGLWNDIKNTKKEQFVYEYMNALSSIQYYSRETYLTRGAYFHVVMEMSNKVLHLNLQPYEYLHSIVDNLAFVAELCQKRTVCPIQYSATFTKMCKYLHRICDALLKLNIDKNGRWNIMEVNDKAAALNAARKQGNADVIMDRMRDMHTFLGLPYYEDQYTEKDLSAIFETVMHIALDPFVMYSQPKSKTKSKSKSMTIPIILQ